jgi:hypothetical protein
MAGWDKGEEPKTKVAILIPHRDEKDYREWRVWFEHLPKPEGTIWFEARGFSLTTNREYLAKQALALPDVTHLLWLDDDTLPPPHSEVKDKNVFDLLQMNVPLASGIYMAKKRKGERGLAAWMYDAERKGYIPIDAAQGSRYVQVDVAGLGCTLAQRWVFEKLSEPWFLWGVPPALSEDFYFFDKCAKELTYELNGAKTAVRPIVDMEMKCRHFGCYVSDTDGSFDLPGI